MPRMPLLLDPVLKDVKYHVRSASKPIASRHRRPGRAVVRVFKLALVCLCFALIQPGYASEVMYEADVRPILKAHCFHCHGEGGKTEGNLDLRLRRFILKGGDSGPAIVPGNASDSLLVQRVVQGEMPPADNKPLSQREVEVLSRWVNANALTARPEPESLAADRYFTDEEKNWWSFRPISKPHPPQTQSQAPAAKSSIDAFILAKLAELAARQPNLGSHFELAAPADRATLIRRLYLDMLGIPPHPDEVRQFVEDSRGDAWNNLVDRVLASPHYGERWGRHWLDAAGYADSEGYTEEDRPREHAYRYRDYVIQAFNQDKPYSEFIIEQLAGDELVGWPAAKLSPEIVERLVATGFLRMAPDGTASGGIDQQLARNQVIADTLQIVGTSLLGLTIHCAQCHDHRYDPIPQRDYYQLRAIFEPALDWKNWKTPPNRLVSLYSEEQKQQRATIEARAKQVDAKRQERIDFFIGKTLEHELLMVADELQDTLRVAFRTKPGDRTGDQKKLLEQHVNIANITAGSLYLYDRRREARAKDLEKRRAEKLAVFLDRVKNKALEALDDVARREVLAAFAIEPNKRNASQQQLASAHPAVGATAATLKDFDPAAAAELERYTTAATEVRAFRIADELKKLADQAVEIRATIPKEHFLRVLAEEPNKAPATFVFYRGDHQQPRDQVEPRDLSVLDGPEFGPVEGAKTSGRRLQFARHLTSGKHPLVARVFVNRVWAQHFGRGIVSTTGDFGYLGERPTHPDLLDWLAAEFVESGWSVKHLHRLILTSSVYQQSSVGSPAVVAADPDNRLLGRWPLRRLESETLRDAILLVAGKLNTELFGEPVPVMEDEVGQIVLGKENLDGERKPTNPIPLLGNEFRRSIYIQVRRSRPLGMLEGFDLPDLAPNCTQRASSNVTPQALMLMNSDFIVSMSAAMADRLIQDHPNQPAEQLRWGWELAFGRAPDDAQLSQALAFLQKQTAAYREQADSKNADRSALATFCQALMGSNRMLYIE